MNRIAKCCLAAFMALAAMPIVAQVAVVKENNTTVTIKDARNAMVERRRVVTLMNDKAASMATFVMAGDKHMALSKFSAEVIDAQGRVIKKFKKSDLSYTELGTEFASDEYRRYLSYTPPSYPVTIIWEWQIEMSGGVLGLPSFVPIDDDLDNVELRSATYRLVAPADYELCWKRLNFDGDIVREPLDNGKVAYIITASDMRLRTHERYTPPLRETLPRVLVNPVRFEYYGTTGRAADWKDYGLWQYDLIMQDYALPQQCVTQLHAMTDTCTTARSRVAVIYDFLAHHTRYVSIQRGLGGLKPAPVEHVYRTGFGDCKGLTNFMRAMLNEVGVPAFYTVISTVNKHLPADFAALGECDHVVLCVPQERDTLWVECTAPQLPLGYVHESIAGHDAIVIDADGGHVVTLPEYDSADNLQGTVMNIALDATGAAVVDFHQTSTWLQYEDKRALTKVTEKERRDALLKMVNVPQATIDSFELIEKKTPCTTPAIDIDATITADRYATVQGTRMFVPCTPMHRAFKALKNATTRSSDIDVDYGYVDEEEIAVTIPEGYEVETLPPTSNVTSPFGSFTFSVDIEGRIIKLRYRYHLRQGRWAAAECDRLIEMQAGAEKAYKARIVLRRAGQ